ncbi:hypothetical protein AO961_31510 [Pseudomonas aeruginosa]|nr:restriction endonuclease [Pseudomonas aeruginosa]OPD88990.1 hypothetical protein AO961_31510 [Pseudomonas aeruginosa]HBP4655574.1 restriction endonuclease [Pseudomonas aeruginosa]HBP4742295.1 restriction endonuclease [Pseudomonas aeruginosa]
MLVNFFSQLTPHQWEYFADYYFRSIGYTILVAPSVGQDGGKDLLVQLGEVKSLVSCKHYSRQPVYESDEKSILDRLSQHGAQQFIGFYSTYGGASLRNALDKDGVDYLLLEGKAIFKNLSNIPFPVHQALFRRLQTVKEKTFGQPYQPLLCKCGCLADLLEPENSEDSVLFLLDGLQGLEIVWKIKTHPYGDSGQEMGLHPLAPCFGLKTLNSVMDSHEVIIDRAALIPLDFERDYCTLLQSLYQMIQID